MKTKSISLKLLIMLSNALATTGAPGQTTVTWTGGDGAGTQIGAATNWGGTLPIPCDGDTGQWDGVVPGNLSLVYDYPGYVSAFCQYGGNFLMTGSQMGSVNVCTTLSSSPNLPLWTLANNSGNASFSLGNNSANVLNIIWRPGNANELHVLENNSTSPNIICPNVRFQSGGGVNHVLSFQGTGDWRLTNNLICANAASTSVQKVGSGTLYWNGPSIIAAKGNGTISSPITISGGTLVLQNNTVLSPNGSGTTGSQNIINDGKFLKYNAPALALTLNGVISGSGPLEVASGTLTLSGQNTCIGSTIVNGGTLLINGGSSAAGTLITGGTLGGTGVLSGPVTLNPGATLAPGASAGSVGKFTINSNLFIGGNLALEVNKSLSPSNDFLVVGGILTNTGSGTLTVANLGPSLAVGDKFTLFNQPVANGAALTIAGAGVTWSNNLAVDGSITVLPAPTPNPPVMQYAVSGNVLSLAWSTNPGWTLQTNSLGLAASNQWFSYPGSAGVTNVNIPISAANTNVFFRLVP